MALVSPGIVMQQELTIDIIQDADAMAANAVAAAEMDAHWPRALTEFVVVLEAGFRHAEQCDAATALRLAQVAVSTQALHSGGKIFYLPSGKKLEAALRDQRIWRKYNGKNIRELADYYGLTEPHVYNIIARQRSLHFKKIQPALL